MKMDKNVASRLSIANVTGMKADSFLIVDGETSIPEVYNDEESKILDDLSSEFLALVELGDPVQCAFTDAQDFACMFSDLIAAKTAEDFEAIAGCYGYLAQRAGVKQYIEYCMKKIQSA